MYFVWCKNNALGPLSRAEVLEIALPDTLVSLNDNWIPLIEHPDFCGPNATIPISTPKPAEMPETTAPAVQSDYQPEPNENEIPVESSSGEPNRQKSYWIFRERERKTDGPFVREQILSGLVPLSTGSLISNGLSWVPFLNHPDFQVSPAQNEFYTAAVDGSVLGPLSQSEILNLNPTRTHILEQGEWIPLHLHTGLQQGLRKKRIATVVPTVLAALVLQTAFISFSVSAFLPSEESRPESASQHYYSDSYQVDRTSLRDVNEFLSHVKDFLDFFDASPEAKPAVYDPSLVENSIQFVEYLFSQGHIVRLDGESHTAWIDEQYWRTVPVSDEPTITYAIACYFCRCDDPNSLSVRLVGATTGRELRRL